MGRCKWEKRPSKTCKFLVWKRDIFWTSTQSLSFWFTCMLIGLCLIEPVCFTLQIVTGRIRMMYFVWKWKFFGAHSQLFDSYIQFLIRPVKQKYSKIWGGVVWIEIKGAKIHSFVLAMKRWFLCLMGFNMIVSNQIIQKKFKKTHKNHKKRKNCKIAL